MAEYDKVILPGEEGKIRTVIKLSNIKGHFSKSFKVDTNDSENAQVILKVKGNVIQVFKASKRVSLTGFVGEDLKMKAVFTNQLDTPIRITGVEWGKGTHDALKRKLETKLEEIEKGKKYAITFDDREQFETGNYAGFLILKTDFEEVKEKKINVRVMVNEEVRAYPNKLLLPEMLVPEGTTRSFNKVVKIVATRGDSLKILKVVSSREDIVTNIKEVKPGKMFRCTLTIRPESKMGEYRGFLTFFTNYTGYEEIKVEILGRVKVIPAAGK